MMPRCARATVRTRKVNGLAWCAQTVMEAGERAAEAAVGIASASPSEPIDTGFEADRVARYLLENGQRIEASRLPSPADQTAAEIAVRLRELAATPDATHSLEDLDRTLGVFEEKLFAALLTGVPEAQLVALREQAARELAPYRGKMQAVQIKQVQQQFLQKKLFEAHKLPRLSLFYMGHD